MPDIPRIFIAYARKDAALLEELRIHLRPLERTRRAVIWYDGNIEPGATWEEDIKKNLHAADIILLLLSAHAIDSDYFYEKEMSDALERHAQGTARVVPLIVRPCAWRATPLAKIQALPKDAKPVTLWSDRDDAWNDAVEALLNFIEERERKAVQEKEAEYERQRKVAEEKQRREEVARRQREEEKRQRQRSPLDPFFDLMVYIPGGSFDMGDTFREGYDSEKPVHKVTVKEFYLCKYLVTQAAWKKIMGNDNNPSYFKRDDRPVEKVTWNDAQDFIKKLNEKTGENYRLPTEAEWEYATRECGKKVRFGNGKDIADPKEINFNASTYYTLAYSVAGVYREKTTPVGSLNCPNALGLYDMSGNVWEWCQDAWHENYKGAPTDGSAWASGGDQSRRVCRGGSAWDMEVDCRSANRGTNEAGYRNYSTGFRVAQDK